MNSPAPAPVSSAKVTINDKCYTGSPSDTLQAFGDSATMGMSIAGMVVTIVCLLLFVYMSVTSPSMVPKIIAVCCACSLASSVWQYVSAKNDIETLKTSGKIRTC